MKPKAASVKTGVIQKGLEIEHLTNDGVRSNTRGDQKYYPGDKIVTIVKTGESFFLSEASFNALLGN